jgi:hypothetical protein
MALRIAPVWPYYFNVTRTPMEIDGASRLATEAASSTRPRLVAGFVVRSPNRYIRHSIVWR